MTNREKADLVRLFGMGCLGEMNRLYEEDEKDAAIVMGALLNVCNSVAKEFDKRHAKEWSDSGISQQRQIDRNNGV